MHVREHWCPWCNKPVTFLGVDEVTGDLVYKCTGCGEQFHDQGDDFCWCDK